MLVVETWRLQPPISLLPPQMCCNLEKELKTNSLLSLGGFRDLQNTQCPIDCPSVQIWAIFHTWFHLPTATLRAGCEVQRTFQLKALASFRQLHPPASCHITFFSKSVDSKFFYELLALFRVSLLLFPISFAHLDFSCSKSPGP